MGNNIPALLSNINESHSAVRDYTLATRRERLGATQPALTHACDVFYKDLKENGKGGRRRGKGGGEGWGGGWGE